MSGVVVHIEIEDATFFSGEVPPSPDSPKPSGRVALAALAVIGVALAIAIGLMRPSEGETLAGTQPNTSPTSVVPSSTTTSSPSTAATAADRVDFSPPPVPVTSTFDSVLRRGDEGSELFLALSGEVDGLRPRLFRSQHGESWQPLPVSVPNGGSSGGYVWVRYSHLVELDDGLAMLRVSSSLPRIRRALSPEVTVQRLRSVDGISWEVDAEFEQLELSGDVVSVFHGEDFFGVADELSFSPVDGSGCENVFVALGSQLRNVTVARRGLTAPETVSTVSQHHTLLEGGTVVSLDVGTAAIPDSCDPNGATVAELGVPAVELLAPDGSLSRIEFPAEVLESLGATGLVAAQLDEVDGRIVMLGGHVVWAVDVDSGEWDMLADRRSSRARFGYRLAPGGWLVEAADRGDVVFTELVSGRTEVVQGGPWGRLPKILYIDDQVMLAVSRTAGASGVSGVLDVAMVTSS